MNEKIVFMGTPKFAADILEGLIKAKYNIVAVVSQPDKEVGRKRVLTPSPVKEVALYHNLPVLTPTKIRKIKRLLSALKYRLLYLKSSKFS